jgi:class 3 adenylate cyclase
MDFVRPGDAIAAAHAMLRATPTYDLALRAGIHFGEVERRPSGDLGGLGVHIAARISNLATADEVLVSRTVTEMVAGSGWSFADRGLHTLKGVPGEWPLFAAS